MNTLSKLSLLFLFAGLTACGSLDEEILGSFTEDFDPENQGVGIKNNVNKASPNDGLSGAFGSLLNGTANHFNYFTMNELASDEAVITQKGGDWFDGGILIDMHRHNFQPQNGIFNESWRTAYDGINQCNLLIASSNTNIAQKAQVRMVRAYLYWRLLDSFGRVKIIKAPGVDQPQATRAEVYQFVVDELNEILPNLPPGRADYGRASQGSANALLSRVYLNAEVYAGTPKYDEAIAAADAVINSGAYDLDPDYKDVFAPDNVDNIEHIFIAAFDESTGGGMNLAQMTLHYPSQLTFRLQQQPWNGYSTLKEFFDLYQDGDERKENNFIYGPQKDFNGNPILDLAFDKGDPDGAEINYTPAINMLQPNGSRQAGARFGKFSFKTGQSPNMDNDYPLLRYGEVLLNKAEALCRKNADWNNGDARAIINQLRTRAGVSTFGTTTEADYLAERGRELFLESLRRTDLIRFGKFGIAWWEKPAHNNANLNLFPIPFNQIQASQSETNKLTQNPGYN